MKDSPPSPLIRVWYQPISAFTDFLKMESARDIAIFLNILTVFIGMMGQYPRDFFSSIFLFLGGTAISFLLVFLLQITQKEKTKQQFWELYCLIALAILPALFAKMLLFSLLIGAFGSIGIYDGLQMAIDILEVHPSFGSLFILPSFFLMWSFFLHIRAVQYHQNISFYMSAFRVIFWGLHVLLVILLLGIMSG